ncbi:MAG: hypothetical protein OEZ03_11260 [Alphaproteobacteria bacterium]|nr:hypothetical protein [Alphaproteobacteria bacterium]
MLGRKYAFLATTALVSSLALTGCFGYGDDNNVAAPLEDPDPVLGVFGLEVGVPVNLISATRGDGVSFDKYAVTFNDEEGTDITITTPEGEEINFTETDIEWLTEIGGVPVARLNSAGGDQLDVVVGSLAVGDQVIPDCEEDCELKDVPVYAAARLDEADTWEGFETYGVVGMQTPTDSLPRYADGTTIEEDDVSGDLMVGTAVYDGVFVASVYHLGEIVSDQAFGEVSVEINFADDSVEFDANGGYISDYNAWHPQWLDVSLSGSGDSDDINFDESVVYSGDLEGYVEVDRFYHDSPDKIDVDGEFAGAVFGPGSDGVYGKIDEDGYFDTVVGDTATAGVFEASGGYIENEVVIVGGFGTGGGYEKLELAE